MPQEIVTVSLSQCCNQDMHIFEPVPLPSLHPVSSPFWQRLCAEYGIDEPCQAMPITINEEGILVEWATKGHDRKDIFLYQAGNDHYIPHTALMDLDPCVINTILSGPYLNM
ncbi:hypothetical protein JB92DRAFT_2751536 [Gautieria morchelliformis]|nr:hypothetical protein JB92DRAFT_2751536 [Gautieria morchelliformis]